MLAGDSTNRDANKIAPGICHVCVGNGEDDNPCGPKDPRSFPPRPCPGGIRATIVFPTCWDGKNLDSPDHRSHMAYSPDGKAFAGSTCPSSHPVRIPGVMYEIMWDTSAFNNPKYFQNGKQPLVYAFGDTYVLDVLFSPQARAGSVTVDY